MNTLSWFLYLADVLPSLSGALGVASVLILVVGGIGVCDLSYVKDCATEKAYIRGYMKTVPLMLFLLFLSFLIPSKDTIYMIAVSEVGEEALKTEMAHDLYNFMEELVKSSDDDAGSE